MIHSIICDPHHTQIKRFLAVCLPQFSLAPSAGFQDTAWAGLGKSRKVQKGKLPRESGSPPEGFHELFCSGWNFSSMFVEKSHMLDALETVASCRQVCIAVLVYLKFQMCNYSLSFLLYIHSLPSVSMVA